MAPTKSNTAALNCKKAKADGFMIRLCPATSNLPTTMSQGAWNNLCAATMKKELAPCMNGGERILKQFCSVCLGKIKPEKLTIIDLKKENNDMARKTETGPCEDCGKVVVALGKNYEKKMCSTCAGIYSAVRNHPEKVERARDYLLKRGLIPGVDEAIKVSVDSKTEVVFSRIAAAVGYEGDDPDGLATRVESCARLPEIQTLKDQLVTERKILQDTEKQLQYLNESYESIRTAIGVTDPTFDIVEAVGEMAQTLDRYKSTCESQARRLFDSVPARFSHDIKAEDKLNDLSGTQLQIAQQCDFLKATLLEKNRKYGDSALSPVRIFSKANPVEQIRIRLDDKISRLQSQQVDDTEDTELDLAGYLVLLRVAREAA